MGVLAGVAFVDVLPNMKKFGSNLTKGISDEQKKTAGQISKTGALIFGSLAAGAGLAVHRAASLQQETQALRQTLHSAANQVIRDSKNQKDSISQIDYLAYAKNAASYATAAGQTHEKAAKFAEEQIRLAQDLGALHGTSTRDALDAIQAALSGSTTGLKRYDLVITQAGIKQQAFADGLIKYHHSAEAVKAATVGVAVAQHNYNQILGGASKNSLQARAAEIQLEQAQKSYNDALKQHGKASLEARSAAVNLTKAEKAYRDVIGGSNKHSLAARTALVQVMKAHQALRAAVKGTLPQLSGQQVILATQSYILHHANGALGAYQKLQGTTSNQVKRATANFTDLTANLGKQLLPYYTQLVGILIQVVGWMGKHQSLVKILVGVIGSLAAAMIVYGQTVKVVTAIQAIYNTIWGETDAVMAANPIGLVVVALAALAAGLIYAYTHSKTFRNIVNGAFHAVGQAVHFVIGQIKAQLNILKIAILGPIYPILILKNHFSSIKGAVTTVISAIKNAFNSFITWQSRLPGRVTGAVAGMFDGIWQAFRSAINKVISGWNSLSFSLPGVNTHIPGVGSIGGFTIGTPDIPLLATGGTLSPGQLGIVGEKGPEFAIGGAGGTSIIPGSRLHFVISNWEEGEGYIEGIARGAIGRHQRHNQQVARMTRP